MISVLPLVIDCVRQHQPIRASQVSAITGIDPLTVHRHLSGGRGKLSNGLFNRVKVSSKRIDSGNRIRGKYHYLYSINTEPKQEPIKAVCKPAANRHPLMTALYGRI